MQPESLVIWGIGAIIAAGAVFAWLVLIHHFYEVVDDKLKELRVI